MGDGTKENPYTRKDVLRLIEENGGTAKGLNLSTKVFEEAIDLSNLNLEGINLRNTIFVGASFRKTNLSSSQLREVNLVMSDLQEASLAYASLEDAQLLGTNLCGVKLSLVEFTYVKLTDINWGNYILGEEKSGDYFSAEETYRRLKIWYTEHGMYDTAAKFYYREKEAGRKSFKFLSRNWHHRLALESLRALFGYGEHWRRILFWMALVIFGSAVAYLFGGLNPLYSFYFSIVSFTALGYGDWVKTDDITDWMQALGAAESFVGVFMMALLLVTFVRKWTR